MPVHKVRQGECLTTICARRGFHDWKTVYDHPKNKDLRAKRPDPNLLYPGDEVFIPEREPKQFSISTGATHNFVAKIAKKRLKLVARDQDGEVLANEPYVLELDTGDEIEGETNGDGLVDKPVPWSVKSGVLYICGLELQLDFAALNPMKDAEDGGVSGARARLGNLGFDVGDEGDSEKLHHVICAFQVLHGVPLSGELDDATLKKLADVYGC